MHTGGVVSDKSLFNLLYTEDGVTFCPIGPAVKISIDYDDIENMQKNIKRY